MKHTIRLFALLAAGLGSASPSFAAPILFTLDTSLSTISIDPKAGFTPGTLPTSMQGPGSWTTNYSGNIYADVTGSTIQILPATTLVAGNSGSWNPGVVYPTSGRAEADTVYTASSAFANYGSVTDLTLLGGPSASNSAIRGIQLTLSDSAPKPLTGGTFSEVDISPSFLAGTVFLSYGASPPLTNLAGAGITITPTGDAPGDGSLTQAGSLLTLTLPISFNVSYFLSSVDYKGTIVATAIVPEPVSVALWAPGAAILLGLRRRGKNG